MLRMVRNNCELLALSLSNNYAVDYVCKVSVS